MVPAVARRLPVRRCHEARLHPKEKFHVLTIFFGKLIAFLAIPLLILTACSSTGGRETAGGDGEAAEGQVADTEQITVAMVTHAVPGDTFWDIVRRGAEENAAKNNVDLIYASDPEGSEQALLM